MGLTVRPLGTCSRFTIANGKIFDPWGRATRRISDVYDYNLQITSLRQKKLWRDAIEVLSDMRHFGSMFESTKRVEDCDRFWLMGFDM